MKITGTQYQVALDAAVDRSLRMLPLDLADDHRFVEYAKMFAKFGVQETVRVLTDD